MGSSLLPNTIDIFPWDENFRTGIGIIDEQHQTLVALLNQLASQVAFRADTLQLARVFDELADYAVYHFSAEESIWHEYLSGHELEQQHLETHRIFVETVQRLRTDQKSRPLIDVAEEALSFLARWLASHILETDRRMAYAVIALKEGQSQKAAWEIADRQMSGATRVLIDIILSIYESLSSNTLRLMREISERKHKEVELIQARLQAEAAIVAKSQFLRNMSHEFRTPLNAVLGLASLLVQDDVSSQDRKKFAGVIEKSGKELLNLVEDILSLSEVEKGVLTLEESMFEPRLLFAELQNKYTPATKNKNLALTLEIDQWVADQYRADAHRIRQMLANLMSNAIKFTETGGIVIAVRQIGINGQEALLEFSVTDTGIGIAQEMQNQLFQPFAVLDNTLSRRSYGPGIGLAIVRHLAELMGGKVGVESQIGKGSRFWFQIRVNTVLS